MRTTSSLSRNACRKAFAILLGLTFAAHAGAPCERATLTAADGASGDDFAAAVAVDGSRAVIGAPEDDDAGSSSGAAYIYRFVGDAWTQQQKLTASDADGGDDYGFSVAISGLTIVVGAPRDDTAAGSSAGSAYVYAYNANNAQWEEQQHLFAGDAEANDRFATSVAIDGDVILIGATQEDEVFSNAGAGYVFTRTAGTWTQQAKLVDVDASGTNPHLGRSAAIDGDVAVLGAWQNAPANMFSVGAAVVYRRDGATWPVEQRLTASDAADFRWFGLSVDVSGAVIAVGAYGDRAMDLSESGGAYLFRFDGATWSEEANVNASLPAANDQFGRSVGVDGATLVVGSGSSAERAWRFEYDGLDWTEQGELASDDPNASSEYGSAVDLDSTGTILVGDSGGGGSSSGLAVVFDADACPPCLADIDGNGEVGFPDLLQVLTDWGPCPGCASDLDGDDEVGFADLLLILGTWGDCP